MDITWSCGATKFIFEPDKGFTSDRSEQVKYFNTRRDILPVQAVKLCPIYYVNTNEMPTHFTFNSLQKARFTSNHNNRALFTCEGNALFSCVKILCFRAIAHPEFPGGLYSHEFSFV